MRSGVSEFIIRINALDFKSLQDRMLRPITILSGVNFNKSVIDRFIEVFKEQISTNPKYKCSEVSPSASQPHSHGRFEQLCRRCSFLIPFRSSCTIVAIFRWPIPALHACRTHQILNCKNIVWTSTHMANPWPIASDAETVIADRCGVWTVWLNGLRHAKINMRKKCGCNRNAHVPCVGRRFAFSTFVM